MLIRCKSPSRAKKGGKRQLDRDKVAAWATATTAFHCRHAAAAVAAAAVAAAAVAAAAAAAAAVLHNASAPIPHKNTAQTQLFSTLPSPLAAEGQPPLLRALETEGHTQQQTL